MANLKLWRTKKAKNLWRFAIGSWLYKGEMMRLIFQYRVESYFYQPTVQTIDSLSFHYAVRIELVKSYIYALPYCAFFALRFILWANSNSLMSHLMPHWKKYFWFFEFFFISSSLNFLSKFREEANESAPSVVFCRWSKIKSTYQATFVAR